MLNRFRLIGIWALCMVATVFASMRMLYSIITNPGKAWMIYIGHDQLLNATAGGDPDQTLFGSDLAVAPGRAELLLYWLRSLTMAAYGLIAMLHAISNDPSLAWVMAVSFDQLANVAANGSRTETISSRAGRARAVGRRWGCLLCWILDRIDNQHCLRSIGV